MIQLIIDNMLIMAMILLTPNQQEEHVPPFNQDEDCVSCHSDLLEHADTHPVIPDACDNCHQPTGRPHPEEGVEGFTLMDSLPELCMYCHEISDPGNHGHQPVEEGACLECHEVHGSAEPVLLGMPEEELCLSCHNGISQLIRGNMKPHSAITFGGCNMCHQAHGTGNRMLLSDAYPAGTYAVAEPDTFGLCFLCHDQAMLVPGDTETATGFRNGKDNLHHIHIQGDKGRNCRLCHNLHGSKHPFLIEEKVPFGNWVMNMNFVSVDNGGSCLPGCHGLKSYQR